MKIDELLSKSFYVIDCEITEIVAEEIKSKYEWNGKDESWAAGRVTLTSGLIEIHFNWIAQGGESAYNTYEFDFSMDEQTPAFELTCVSLETDENIDDVLTRIINLFDWTKEVAECFPKNGSDIATLDI